MSVAGIPLRLVSKCLSFWLWSLGWWFLRGRGPRTGSVAGGMACRFETGETFLSLVIVFFFFDGASTAAPLNGGLEIHMYNGSTRHFKEQTFNDTAFACSRRGLGLGVLAWSRICDSINDNTSGLDERVSSLRPRGFSIWSV